MVKMLLAKETRKTGVARRAQTDWVVVLPGAGHVQE